MIDFSLPHMGGLPFMDLLLWFHSTSHYGIKIIQCFIGQLQNENESNYSKFPILEKCPDTSLVLYYRWSTGRSPF
jgi:hypothetical protein